MGGCTHHKSWMENMRWLEMTSFPLATKAEAWMEPSNIAASVWFVWINCFFVANQLMDCFGSFFPRCFQKKQSTCLVLPPKKCRKHFFPTKLRCFFVVPHHENSILWFNDFYQRRVSCRTTVGMFLGGASRGDDFFFGGGNFPRLFTFRCILHKNTCDIRI